MIINKVVSLNVIVSVDDGKDFKVKLTPSVSK